MARAGGLLCESFRQLDDLAALAGAPNLSERDDQAKTLDRARLRLVVLRQRLRPDLQIGKIVGAHIDDSAGGVGAMTRKNDLSALAAAIISAIEQARHLKLPTSAYILSMALMEVMQARDGMEGNHKSDSTQ
jgi:hypothetical protein